MERLGHKQTGRLMGQENKKCLDIRRRKGPGVWAGRDVQMMKEGSFLKDWKTDKNQTDWQKHVSRRTKWKTDTVLWSDGQDSSVSQTSKGKRRFKASVVDTRAASRRGLSPGCQELTLTSQSKLHYHHRYYHYDEKWKSYWVQSKALNQTTFNEGFTAL